MLFRTLTPVHYAGSYERILYKFDRFTFTNDKGVIEGLFPKDKFTEFLGSVTYNAFINEHHFFIISQDTLDEKDSTTRRFELNSKFEQENAMISVILSSIWFLFDNNIFNTISFLYDELLDEYIYNSRAVMFSNSSGSYKPCEINNQIIMALPRIANRVISFRNADVANLEKAKNDIIGFGSNVGNISEVNFSTTSRIFRALSFLDLARSQSLLPLKISMYIGVLECLFTTDSSEVSHKVAENAAFYISRTSEERVENYELIKAAYSVRSKYLHGQRLDKKKHKSSELLMPISRQIDELLRSIFTQITIEDGKIFLKSDDELRLHFRNLVFGIDNNNRK